MSLTNSAVTNTTATTNEPKRKPQNQIINRQLRRTQMVKRELIEKMLEEQGRTQAALVVPPDATAPSEAMRSESSNASWIQRLFASIRAVTHR